MFTSKRAIIKSLGGEMKKMKMKTNFCLAKKRSGVEGKTLRKDERAVSAVIGVILMIAITVVIAAVVAAFAYGIIGSVKTAPSSSIVIENAQRSATPIDVTLIHQGGDIITDAFDGSATTTSSTWKNIEVRHNGTITNRSALMNNSAVSSRWANDFKPGDELKINFSSLASDDTIAVVYTPSGDILQRVKVA
jgi:flagellin-like protein